MLDFCLSRIRVVWFQDRKITWERPQNKYKVLMLSSRVCWLICFSDKLENSQCWGVVAPSCMQCPMPMSSWINIPSQGRRNFDSSWKTRSPKIVTMEGTFASSLDLRMFWLHWWSEMVKVRGLWYRVIQKTFCNYIKELLGCKKDDFRVQQAPRKYGRVCTSFQLLNGSWKEDSQQIIKFSLSGIDLFGVDI